MGNPLKSIVERAQKLVTAGLERPPQAYLYLDKDSLKEHYQAITGTARIPDATHALLSSDLSSEIGFFKWFKWSAKGSVNTGFTLSDYHLFESLEPELRKLPVAKSAADFETTLRAFTWLSGRLSWERMGEGDGAVLSYIVTCADTPFMLVCREESFSPFVPFFHPQTIHLYRMVFEVEVLAYNPGVLGQYYGSPHPAAGMALALVPTVIIVKDTEQRAQIADWIKKLNAGKLSRSYGL